MKRLDAIVIGAGPAGGTAALLLARAGWSVAVVEKACFPRRKVCGEFVSAASLPLLRGLGLDDAFVSTAGPEVHTVGAYAGDVVALAAMPAGEGRELRYGRALAREALDALILARAQAAGAAVWQPYRAARVSGHAGAYACEIVARNAVHTLEARCIIAAHGSWETGGLPSQHERTPHRASDLLGFKAHFRCAPLADGVMPLVAFPGGYGGLVRTSGGRTGYSCCVRRDVLTACRERYPNLAAGAAVLMHARASNRGLREALRGATLEGAWLAAGPVRPGIRRAACAPGFYAVGNAAGEAHPIVAEGISMAMQSAGLLCGLLLERAPDSTEGWSDVAHEYGRRWRASFAARIGLSMMCANLARRPALAEPIARLLARVPALLTLGARASGKTQEAFSAGGAG